MVQCCNGRAAPVEGDLSLINPKTSATADPDPDENRASRVRYKASNNRRSRALQIVNGEEPVVHIGGDVFSVPSETRCARYVVNMEHLTCECPYWRKVHAPCKHIEAVRIFRSNNVPPSDGGIRTLPNPYKNPPWYDKAAAKQLPIFLLLARSLALALDAQREESQS